MHGESPSMDPCVCPRRQATRTVAYLDAYGCRFWPLSSSLANKRRTERRLLARVAARFSRACIAQVVPSGIHDSRVLTIQPWQCINLLASEQLVDMMTVLCVSVYGA